MKNSVSTQVFIVRFMLSAAVFMGVGFFLLSRTSATKAQYDFTQTAPAASATPTLLSQTSPCIGEPQASHTITFTNSGITPAEIEAKACDEIVVVNSSNEAIKTALGPHDHHTHVAGFEETTLQPGEIYSFRLAKKGTFPVHDHDNATEKATLIISE